MDVLLVEDDVSVRSCLIDVLSEAGLRVVAASTAAEALGLPETMQPPAVLVTDVRLGAGMDGVGLAVLARHRWPGIRIVVMSGGHEIADGICGPIDRFLPKPFREIDLLQAIGN